MNVNPEQKHSSDMQPIASTSSQPCSKPNVVRRLSSAEKMGLDKIEIKDLQRGDMFSFDGEKIFIFSKVKEVIGCGLVTIHYLSTKRWASFDRIIKETKLVYAAPYGRSYKG